MQTIRTLLSINPIIWILCLLPHPDETWYAQVFIGVVLIFWAWLIQSEILRGSPNWEAWLLWILNIAAAAGVFWLVAIPAIPPSDSNLKPEAFALVGLIALVAGACVGGFSWPLLPPYPEGVPEEE